MISVEEREQVRRAYFVENKSVRGIARELRVARKTVRKALASAEPATYTLSAPRPSPVLGPYKARIDELLAAAEKMPRKQRYTGHKIFEMLVAAGYTGAESSVRAYIGQRRREKRRPQVFIPLEFDPGTDAQVDWGECAVQLAGEVVTVQFFCMRLAYSRRMFVMAFPAQSQVAFFEGHVQAFHFFGGVPQRISYDNLKAAVQEVLQGHSRREQQSFVVFRSHYLFDSHFCTPGQGHEKGGVEHEIGFARRNYLMPIPVVNSYQELNQLLLERCLQDDNRTVDGQAMTIGAAWALEKPHLRPLPGEDFRCCMTKPVALTPYSQVEFETNRYSLPADKVERNLVLRAYPFHVEVLYQEEILASHPRCYGRNQDVFDPLHYLPLLEQRPGAFEHAKPLRRWRSNWPHSYEQLLAALRAEDTDGRSVREFVRVLKLHQHYPAELVEQGVVLALQYGSIHADGVQLCIRQHLNPEARRPALDLSGQPQFVKLASYDAVPDLQCYNRLLMGGSHGQPIVG